MTNLIGVALVIVFALVAVSALRSSTNNDETGADTPAQFRATPQQKRKAVIFYIIMMGAVIIFFLSSYLVFFGG